MKPILNIVGCGIRGGLQLSLEGLEVIQHAKKVYYLPGASQEIETALIKMGVHGAENLISLYLDGENDKENYERLFHKLTSATFEYGDVACLVPGHPRIGVSVVQELERKHEELGIRLSVLPGISSFCTMINDLKRDPLERGSLLIDANRLILFDIPMSASLDSYIYHICSVGTSKVHLTDASKENHILILKEHLLKFFGEDHKAILIGSSVSENDNPTFIHGTVGELENLLPHVHFGTTLFLPAQKISSFNRDYLKLLVNGVSA